MYRIVDDWLVSGQVDNIIHSRVIVALIAILMDYVINGSTVRIQLLFSDATEVITIVVHHHKGVKNVLFRILKVRIIPQIGPYL